MISSWTRQINAPGKTNTLTYCNCGILDSTTDAVGKTTSFTSDDLGQRTQIAFPGGTTNACVAAMRLTDTWQLLSARIAALKNVCRFP